MLLLILSIIVLGLGEWLLISAIIENDWTNDLEVFGIFIIIIALIVIICNIAFYVSHGVNADVLKVTQQNLKNKLLIIEEMNNTDFAIEQSVMVDMKNKDLGLKINESLADLNNDISKYNIAVVKLQRAYKNRLVTTCYKDFGKDLEILTYKKLKSL